MRTGGQLRWRLANSLRTAYAIGLLTEDTFAHRIDHLYGGGLLLEPDQLIGDLSFRGRRRQYSVRDTVTRFAARLGRRTEGPPALPVLALDWSGSVLQLLVGRGSHCDLVVENQTVSRHHAQLFFREGSWILVDLDSTNGTYINGVRVQRSQLLAGDVLTLGAARLLVD